ncbi:4-hydroxyphenylacetate 3-monooxygenase oxygenase component [Geodia barretti]|uniref:4-hydroxyphenylacetate 3-monooxygenase oxygenase component n=1 Tax=Geodia barretti TaxID=519541 RepID=A0AA35X5M2_GEOBA|nr:4-hydroxyphenylacetate 3-monooxygenase oxygenase component [Geodia barretti]
MPARTGAAYLAGLKEQQREIWLDGRRVDDVTEFPGLANGARSIAQLYDMQHDAAASCAMTYASPATGDPVGLSFIIPRTKDDLARRREMMSRWAHASYGMMGRTPDFLNVTIMSMAAAGDFFGDNRPEFKQNVTDYYEHARDNDLCMTHTLVNLQRNRAPSATSMNYSTDVALHVVKETDAGLVVRGPRVLATLGPLSDEIMVYPTRSSLLARDEDAHKYAFAFAVPCGIDGLKFICRESFDLGKSHFDHPLGSRFEEMDAIVYFDDVLVPWERVFMYGDRHKCNNMSAETGQYVHTGHQVVTKNVAKCEFITGIASLMVNTLGNGDVPQVQGLLAELVENLEITKALLTQSEVNAKLDNWGVMLPDRVPLNVARNLFIKMYPRMAEIIQLLGSSSLMALPSEQDFGGPMGEVLDTYLDTDTATARERVRLFRLAWDAACSSFAGRQVLYERYFQGDWMRNAALLLGIYDREPMMEQVREFLERD